MAMPPRLLSDPSGFLREPLLFKPRSPSQLFLAQAMGTGWGEAGVTQGKGGGGKEAGTGLQGATPDHNQATTT